jgi:stage V sporulation protein K
MDDVLAVTTTADPFDGLIISQELQVTKKNMFTLCFMLLTIPIQKYVDGLSGELRLARALKRRPPPIKHVVFVGPPGTGKTTAARAMARLLRKAGVLPTSNIVERSAEDMVAGFVGQTAGMVTDMLKEAQGGVLFIDEAHRLSPFGGHRGADKFKEEAMGVLIAAMTSPDYADNLLIVLAGYTVEMDNMLEADPGLKRRIGSRVEFKDITAEEAEKILHAMLEKDKTRLDPICHGSPIQEIFTELKSRSGWGNIGDVVRLAQYLFSAVSARLLKTASEQENEDNGNLVLASWDHIYTRYTFQY